MAISNDTNFGNLLKWSKLTYLYIYNDLRSHLEQGKSEGFDSCDRHSNLTQIGFKSSIFQPVWPWNLMDELQINRVPLLCYIKLRASFPSHRWIETGVTVRKRLLRVKIVDFLSHVTLKFDRLPLKTIGHLFYVASSVVHHFIDIGEFKLKLQSGNAQFGSKSAMYCFMWPWNLTDDLENNRAHFLCFFKLYASFHSHQWIQTKVAVRKRSIGVEIGDFWSHVTFKLDGWPWKTIGYLFYATSTFVHHFVAIGEFKPELRSGNSQFGSKLTIFFSRVTLIFDGWPWKTIGHLS